MPARRNQAEYLANFFIRKSGVVNKVHDGVMTISTACAGQVRS
jgi:hypothetical protein